MIRISAEQIEDVIFCDMKPVLEMKLQYPQISGRIPMKAETVFNNYYLTSAQSINKYIRSEIAAKASREFRRMKTESFPFSMHSFSRNMSVRAVSEKICCITFDIYRYDGGNRGRYVRTCDIWSVSMARRIRVTELFPKNFSIKKAFMPSIISQLNLIPENERLPDAQNTAERMFSASNICMTKDGFEVFYPIYSLCPFEKGITSFSIPYDLPGIIYLPGNNPCNIDFISDC